MKEIIMHNGVKYRYHPAQAAEVIAEPQNSARLKTITVYMNAEYIFI